MEVDFLQIEFVRGALAAIDTLAFAEYGCIIPFVPYVLQRDGMRIKTTYMPDTNISQVEILISEESPYSQIFNNKNTRLSMTRYTNSVIN